MKYAIQSALLALLALSLAACGAKTKVGERQVTFETEDYHQNVVAIKEIKHDVPRESVYGLNTGQTLFVSYLVQKKLPFSSNDYSITEPILEGLTFVPKDKNGSDYLELFLAHYMNEHVAVRFSSLGSDDDFVVYIKMLNTDTKESNDQIVQVKNGTVSLSGAGVIDSKFEQFLALSWTVFVAFEARQDITALIGKLSNDSNRKALKTLGREVAKISEKDLLSFDYEKLTNLLIASWIELYGDIDYGKFHLIHMLADRITTSQM